MSSDLYWRPGRPAPPEQFLGYQLKFALSGVYYDHDGSLTVDWFTMTKKDIPFLQGVIAASANDEMVKEAQELVKHIEKHGSVEIKLA